jgi:arylsulfatase A-like enzyme
MNPKITRRDFLKLASAMTLAPLVDRATSMHHLNHRDQPSPNIIIILYDALSTFNLSLYGYQRKTSPKLERFASRATVYHNHHSAGNFTTPSTASLFTSTYPWTHRAFNLSSLIRSEVQPHNLFRLLKEIYYLNAFSQNIYSDMLLYQFEEYFERHQGLDSFSLAGHTFYDHLFPSDAIYGMRSYDQFLFVREEAHGALFLSLLNDLAVQLENRKRSEELADIYPEELPRLANTDVNFRIDQVTDGVKSMLDHLAPPFLSYIHFMPPHAPYVPSREYAGMFDDGWSPPAKKAHRLAAGISEERMYELRHTYDEYIANLDAEFGRLLDHLEETGLLDSSYVIFTSDHGELFERGVTGHSTPLVFEPVVRIPLIISAPGQRDRKDIHVLTSNVDLCPTILRIADLDIPEWCEGQVLPGMGGQENPDRCAYVVEAKANPAHKPFRKATLAILKGQYKLIQYLGYRYYKDKIECFDLKNDPDELHNLYPANPIAKELWDELQLELEKVNRPFIGN